MGIVSALGIVLVTGTDLESTEFALALSHVKVLSFHFGGEYFLRTLRRHFAISAREQTQQVCSRCAAACTHFMPSVLVRTLTASHHPDCAPPTYASHKHRGRDTRLPFMLAKMNGSRSSQYMIPGKPCGGRMAPQSRGCCTATCLRFTFTSMSSCRPTGWRQTVVAFHARTYPSNHSPS